MHFFHGTFLLFALNLLDAVLTIVWVRNGIAIEGNELMAKLLEVGDFTFLGAKVAIGIITTLVLLRWGKFKLAKYGLAVALAAYISVIGIHLFTGLSAFGIVSPSFVQAITQWPGYILALFI